MTTFGSGGVLTYGAEGIMYKSSFMNFGGKFACKLNELEKIDESIYLDFVAFPRKCVALILKKKKFFNFKFASDNDRRDFFDFFKDNNINNLYG